MVKNDEAFSEPFMQADCAANRLTEWRTRLIRLSAGSLPGVSEDGFLGRELKGAAVIASMAELEAILREMLISIGNHINSSRVRVKELRPSLRALIAHADFVSLQTLRDINKVWPKRLGLTSLDEAEQIAILPVRLASVAQPPLDGRTIQARHIALVWQVLGLEEPIPEPSALVIASLKKLTQIRNDVAHRNIRLEEVFLEAGRSADDLEQHLDRVVLLITHMAVEWDTYLRQQKYLR